MTFVFFLCWGGGGRGGREEETFMVTEIDRSRWSLFPQAEHKYFCRQHTFSSSHSLLHPDSLRTSLFHILVNTPLPQSLSQTVCLTEVQTVCLTESLQFYVLFSPTLAKKNRLRTKIVIFVRNNVRRTYFLITD